MNFSRAIVRTPGESLVQGISTSDLGRPDHDLALLQHAAYIEALKACGLGVRVLEANEDFPDSTFVEDVALLTSRCAIILNPGAPSRKGEIDGMDSILVDYFENLHHIPEPGTVEGGDILQVEDHYFIGLTERTNQAGALAVITILEKYGLTGSMVPVSTMLHLKSGLSYLNGQLLIAAEELLNDQVFQDYPILRVDPDEVYAANCLYINGNVLLPAGYPKTQRMLENEGFQIKPLDLSEYRKLDGGMSCLSLRF